MKERTRNFSHDKKHFMRYSRREQQSGLIFQSSWLNFPIGLFHSREKPHGRTANRKDKALKKNEEWKRERNLVFGFSLYRQKAVLTYSQTIKTFISPLSGKLNSTGKRMDISEKGNRNAKRPSQMIRWDRVFAYSEKMSFIKLSGLIWLWKRSFQDGL